MRSVVQAGGGAATAIVIVAGVLLTGCQSAGRVEFASLDFRAIDPPSPEVSRLALNHCYWWEDEQGRVWIAMEHERPVLLGVERLTCQLSLLLEKLPAGRARNYHATRRQLRGVARLGPAQARFVSTAGIVALYREAGERLRGSFRLRVSQHSQQLLGGWSKPVRFLMLGEFVATRNEEAGRRILAETESDGWEHGEATTTQPTTQGARVTPAGGSTTAVTAGNSSPAFARRIAKWRFFNGVLTPRRAGRSGTHRRLRLLDLL